MANLSLYSQTITSNQTSMMELEKTSTTYIKLDKTLTGISCEFLAAGELARRGFNVSVTFGNTKAIDLLVEKDGKQFKFQVKGIQRNKSICWNISRHKIEPGLFFILVNLNADKLNEQVEFFVLTAEEMTIKLKHVKSGRDYIDYNLLKREGYLGGWEKIK